MEQRRWLSGWCVLSLLLVAVFFGLFFAFTERRSWPQLRTLMAPGDMRFAPPASTFWCEGVDLRAQRPFVAYQVSGDPHIVTDAVNERDLNMTLKGRSHHFLRYFLLPASSIEVVACSAQHLFLIKGGESEAEECLQGAWRWQSSESQEEDSSSEEAADDPCPSRRWSATPSPGSRCAELKVNVSDADVYVVAVVGRTAVVSVRVRLHRSRYLVHRSGSTFRMCSLANTCTIGLTWGSNDRALIWLPEEDNKTGTRPVVVYSWCRPRLALFALLSVMLPLVLFVAAALALRRIRQRHVANNRRCRAEPLITPPTAEDPPPAYETLEESPPPYACLKHGR